MNKLLLAVAFGLLSSSVVAEDHSNHKHHDHTNHSVSATDYHNHGAGEWMFTYRNMQMKMDGMRDGTDDLSTSEVLADFMVTPTRMSMEMHMFGAMYGISDALTVMAMVPYHKKDMDHVTRMGVRFTTRSEGVGDVKLVGLYNLETQNSGQLQFKAGISVPTGDIDAEDETPASGGADVQLPYPMQIGSGSWDLLPGIIYSSIANSFDWGVNANAVIRLNDNDNDYRLGNRLELSGWASKPLNQNVSALIRLKGTAWNSIDGADPDLNPMMVPTADPDNFGGKRVDLSGGLLVSPATGGLAGHIFGVEIGAPIYEDLDGTQMSLDWSLMAKWQILL